MRSSIHNIDEMEGSAKIQENVHPASPAISSRRTNRRSNRQQAVAGHNEPPRRSNSVGRTSTEIPTSSSASTNVSRQRGSSLTSRFPGDQSHRPLERIRQETKAANRAPHLRKKHIPGPDTIDRLDCTGGRYHHDGPYDATLLARNVSLLHSPVQAVSRSNMEALKATPREKVMDSLHKHYPLDGVAFTPPGVADRDGQVYHYEEGSNMMIEDGGDYKRWPGVVSVHDKVLYASLYSPIPRNTLMATSKAKASHRIRLRRP